MARPRNIVLEPEAHVVQLTFVWEGSNLIGWCWRWSVTVSHWRNLDARSSHCGWINLGRKGQGSCPVTLAVSPTRVRCFIGVRRHVNDVFIQICIWHVTHYIITFVTVECCAHFFRPGPATTVSHFVKDWRWLSLTFLRSCHHGTFEATSKQCCCCAGSWRRLFAAGQWLHGLVIHWMSTFVKSHWQYQIRSLTSFTAVGGWALVGLVIDMLNMCVDCNSHEYGDEINES